MKPYSAHIETLTVSGEELDVYGYRYGAEQDYDYYDVFDANGNCINAGEPFYEKPTHSIIKEFCGK